MSCGPQTPSSPSPHTLHSTSYALALRHPLSVVGQQSAVGGWWVVRLLGGRCLGLLLGRGQQRLLLLSGSALGQEDGVDVGEHASLGDGHVLEELVQLLVVAHGQLNMTRDNASFLVVLSGIARELQHLSAEVLEDGGAVHHRPGAHTVGDLRSAQKAAHARNGELLPTYEGNRGFVSAKI
jgi:hypothetical protein